MTDKAVILEIADAVVAYLKAGSDGGTFGDSTFAPTREYVPAIDLGDFRSLKVTVFPRELDAQWVSRSAAATDYKLDVGVQKKLTKTDPAELKAELDALMLLVEAIIGYLWESMRLPDLPAAMLRNVEHSTVYSTDHLVQLRQFTSVFTLTYRVVE